MTEDEIWRLHEECHAAIDLLADLAREALRLREVLRHTHERYCDESRSRHAPECLLYELDEPGLQDRA